MRAPFTVSALAVFQDAVKSTEKNSVWHSPAWFGMGQQKSPLLNENKGLWHRMGRYEMLIWSG
jgi:hypothetical protein